MFVYKGSAISRLNILYVSVVDGYQSCYWTSFAFYKQTGAVGVLPSSNMKFLLYLFLQ